MNAWIPAQASRGVPWALEVANISQGQPKVSRIPTGGWRGIGAVPSHSYPYETDVPGYWSGLGQVASTVDAQATKTTPPGYGDATVDALKAVLSSATEAYIANQRYLAYRRTGDPSLIAPPLMATPGATPPAGPGGGMSTTTMLMIGGAAVAGLVLFMGMRKKR